MAVANAHLRIEIETPDDVGNAVQFFEQTVYETEQVDERTVLLTAPRELDGRTARREVEIYLRLLRRMKPGLAAALLD
jgi:hypothetical protein